ncbi:MAG: cell division protein ZapB [bacterium]|nr:cell division protein ZapB [bacterium]
MELADDQELDPLDSLEERIHRAVGLIPQLREEKDNAVRERDAAVRESAEAKARLEAQIEELDTLREERNQVRARIEKLLGHMDVLGSG